MQRIFPAHDAPVCRFRQENCLAPQVLCLLKLNSQDERRTVFEGLKRSRSKTHPWEEEYCNNLELPVDAWRCMSSDIQTSQEVGN